MLGLGDLVYFWVIPNLCHWASFGNVSKAAASVVRVNEMMHEKRFTQHRQVFSKH